MSSVSVCCNYGTNRTLCLQRFLNYKPSKQLTLMSPGSFLLDMVQCCTCVSIKFDTMNNIYYISGEVEQNIVILNGKQIGK